jgi:peroxiredoxin
MVKIFIRYGLLSCLCILLLSCSQPKSKNEGFRIQGNVTGFPDGTKFYLQDVATSSTFDSAVVSNGDFLFEGKLSNPPEHILLYTVLDNDFIRTTLFIGNDAITIEGDKHDFKDNLNIKGSPTHDEYNELNKQYFEFYIRRDSLFKLLFSEYGDQERNALSKKIDEIDSIVREIVIDYVNSHPTTYTGMYNLNFLTHSLPKDTIRKMYDRYSDELKNSKYGKAVEVFLSEHILEVGDEFHDFVGLNQQDEQVKFSDKRGLYTLLEFTAAYCAPCIWAVDELKEVNNHYGDSLTIVSFSQDASKDVWKASIKRDGIDWTSIWDGKGSYSETSIKYGIDGIPSFVLIDPAGTIKGMWSGYGKGRIISKLKEHLPPN